MNRPEWLSLVQWHSTTRNAHFEKRVPSWLTRRVRKNKEVEIPIFHPHWTKKRASFPANKGESANSSTLSFENNFWVFPAEPLSKVAYLLRRNPEKAHVGCRPSSRISIQKAFKVTFWVEAKRDAKPGRGGGMKWPREIHRVLAPFPTSHPLEQSPKIGQIGVPGWLRQ